MWLLSIVHCVLVSSSLVFPKVLGSHLLFLSFDSKSSVSFSAAAGIKYQVTPDLNLEYRTIEYAPLRGQHLGAWDQFD